jgi:hypothetical protein
MRQNWLSNRIFKSFDDIVDHCCYAWNTLMDQPWKIMSIARRDSLNLRIGIRRTPFRPSVDSSSLGRAVPGARLRAWAGHYQQ